MFARLVILLNLVLAGLRLGLKNRQAGEKWIFDDYSYLCKGLFIIKKYRLSTSKKIIYSDTGGSRDLAIPVRMVTKVEII
ncbi:hypothetical protein [uncultured Gammaproteobacteria bacterium]|nr:hypothetical protein [uncultured Gammaproteobacteria bacterium]